MDWVEADGGDCNLYRHHSPILIFIFDVQVVCLLNTLLIRKVNEIHQAIKPTRSGSKQSRGWLSHILVDGVSKRGAAGWLLALVSTECVVVVAVVKLLEGY